MKWGTVVADIPVYKGIALYVADKETGRIYGATDVSKIGVKLDDMGLRKQRKRLRRRRLHRESFVLMEKRIIIS